MNIKDFIKQWWWVFVIGVLLLFLVFQMCNDPRMALGDKRTNEEIEELVRPIFDNTKFIVNGEKYNLVLLNMEFHTKHDKGDFRYAKKGDAYANFYILKEGERKKINEGIWWQSLCRIPVKRDNRKSKFYIDGEELKKPWYSILGGMFIEVSSHYFIGTEYFEDEITEDSNGQLTWHGPSCSASNNEDEIEYDKYGNIIKSIKVEYSSEVTSKDNSLIFETSFELKDLKEYKEIEVTIKNQSEKSTIKKP